MANSRITDVIRKTRSSVISGHPRMVPLVLVVLWIVTWRADMCVLAVDMYVPTIVCGRTCSNQPTQGLPLGIYYDFRVRFGAV